MKTFKENKLMVWAYTCLAISILSVFTTVVGYTNASGVHRTFTLVDFLSANGNGFDEFVSCEYSGQMFWTIDISIVRVFAVIGITAFVCALVGLAKISKQEENTGSFVLTLFGLIGTMAPSLLILSCIVVLGNNYRGTIHSGIYPIVSPLAMILCIIAATQMHRKNVEFQKKLNAAEGLIFRGGDL